jgi:hypothetical protein
VESAHNSAHDEDERTLAWLVRLRVFVTLLATMVLVGILPGAMLVTVVPAEDETLEPAPVPDQVADRPGLARVMVKDLDGRPIHGAIARALLVDGGNVYLAGRATTDATGLATLTHLPVGTHWLIVEARGHARASTQRFVGEDPIDVELRLGPERALDVEVYDDLGRAIPAAELEIRGADPLPRGARTALDGIAHTTGVGEGALQITVKAPGYDPTTLAVPSGDVHTKIVLHKLGAIQVVVVDLSGKPVQNATVAIAGGALVVPRTTTTGADGTTRIAGLGAGSYDLRAWFGDTVAPVEVGVSLKRGDEKTVRLMLEAGRTIVARVVDESGRPIFGAQLVAVEGGISPFPVEATTDASGIARLGPFPRSTSAAIGARAKDYVPRGPIEVPPGDSTEPPIEIVLRRAATLIGDVMDAQHRPIDGATIEVVGTDLDGLPIDATPASIAFQTALFARSAAGPKTLLPIGELGVVPGPVPPIPHGPSLGGGVGPTAEALAAIDPWVTRGDGTFRATPLPAGRLRAIVRHPDYVEAISEAVFVASGEEGKVTVVLAAGGRLEGTVKDDKGRPVDGAWVEIAARTGSLARGVRTASDGTFVLAAVPAEVTITVAPPDRPFEAVVRADATVPEGGTQHVDLVLPAPRDPCTVLVRDDRHYPIVGAQVTVSSLDPTQPAKATAFTSDQGEAEIPRVVGLKVQVEVRAPGHAPDRRVVDAIGSKLDVELAEGIVVKGVVYAPGGRAWLQGATISLLSAEGVRHATSDKDGAFQFTDVAKGGATIEIRAEHAATMKKPIDVTPKGSIPEVDLGRLELGAAGDVEGDVIDEKGHPVPGARVARDRAPTYVPSGGTLPGVAVTDAFGAFKLSDVAVGDAVVIEAFAADVGRGRSDPIRIDEGRTTSRVRIVLQPSDAPSVDDLAPGGVAITLAESDGKIVIAAVAAGSEAERAGLAEGDEIVAVDGAAVTTLAATRTRLDGPLGADVIIRIKRVAALSDVRVVREATKR